MKVVQINIVCNGSTGRIMCQIQKIATENGIDATSFYGRGISADSNKFIQIGSQRDVLFHVLRTRLLDQHGHGSKIATQKMVEQLKIIKPDIIHLHNIHGYYLHIETLFNFIKESGVKVIWTLHDCWAFTGHCSHFIYAKCDKWQKNCFSCIQKNCYPQSWFRDNSKNQFLIKKSLFTGVKNLTIVTPSKWLSDLVEKSFLNEYPVKVINNGIDLSIFKPTDGSKMRAKLSIPDSAKIILGVASVWDERKGLKYFLELAKIIDKEFIIVVVGLNQKQIKSLPKNLIGITRTENIPDLVSIYSMSDVFVNPSIEETFSLVTLEAIACGTPCVIFDHTPMTEFITKDCGEIVSENCTNKLLEAIDRIVKNTKTHYSNNCILQSKKFNYYDSCINYTKLYYSNNC